MRTRTILTGPILLLLLFPIIIPARAQTAKPAGASQQAAARKQFAAYIADFRVHPKMPNCATRSSRWRRP